MLLVRQQRASVERGLRETARALSVAVDEHVASAVASLEVLAASESLDTGDLAAFHRLASRVSASQRWASVHLVRPSGEQVVSTLQPYGTPLVSLAGRPYFRHMLRTGTAVASDLLVGRTSGEPRIVISVPARRGGDVRYVVLATLPPDSLSAILARQQIPAQWTGAVLDGNSVIVARSRAAGGNLGRPATEVLARRTREAPEGTFWDLTRDGYPSYGAFVRTARTGWTVVLAVPASTVSVLAQPALWAVLAGGLLLLLVATGLAARFGRRFARPIASLAASASALGRGEMPPALASSSVLEVDAVARAIERAAAERARAETTLREANQTFDALIQASPAAIVVLDPAGIVRLWNPAAERIFGWTAAEVLGLPLPGVADHEQGAFETTLAQVLAGRPLDPVEARQRRKDGRLVDVEISTAVLRDAEGAPRYVMCLVEDVTERSRAEAERARLLAGERAARTEAEAARRRAAFLAEATTLLASSLDSDATLGSVARLAAGHFGDLCLIDLVEGDGSMRRVAVGHADPQRGEEAKVLQAYPPDPAGRHPAARVVRTGRAEWAAEVAESVLPELARDAAQLDLIRGLGLVSYVCVPLAGRGRILGTIWLSSSRAQRRFDEADVVLAEDLGRRVALAVDNARLYQEAQEAIRAREAFLARASHELRTPLTGALGTLRLLEKARAGVLKASPDELLAIARRNLDAMLALTNNLLDASKLAAGREALAVEPVEVAELVRRTLDLVAAQAGDGGVTFRVSVSAGLRWLADPLQVEQVLVNLFVNAVKFTPPGGVVSVEAEGAGGEVTLRVRDTGEGIAREDLDRIFEPFYQADRASRRRSRGTGLGLAICRQIVTLHGGVIWAESEGRGLGSTFLVRLPAGGGTRVAARVA